LLHAVGTRLRAVCDGSNATILQRRNLRDGNVDRTELLLLAAELDAPLSLRVIDPRILRNAQLDDLGLPIVESLRRNARSQVDARIDDVSCGDEVVRVPVDFLVDEERGA